MRSRLDEKLRLEYRKAHGLCRECGVKTSGNYRCDKHRKSHNKQQKRKNDQRKQLGFCAYCLTPAVPGITKCMKHKEIYRQLDHDRQDKRIRERGWKLGRVPV